MWGRFELFWTAFERFALFFSFVATLVILVTLVLIYDAAVTLEPHASPMHVEPVVQTLSDALAKIQRTVLSTEVTISHTVPIVLDIRFNPAQTNLEIVQGSKINAGEITINLLDGAGTLVGQGATLDVSAGNSFQVRMDYTKQVKFDVPLRFSVLVRIPLESVNLTPELAALQVMTGALDAASVKPPGTASGQMAP